MDRDEDGRAKVDITYRFGPPEAPLEADRLVSVQGTRRLCPAKKRHLLPGVLPLPYMTRPSYRLPIQVGGIRTVSTGHGDLRDLGQ